MVTPFLMGSWGGAITLPTADKYLEGDIVIAGEGGGTVISDVLEDNEWSVISEVAQAGESVNYWNVGDTKSVLLSGTVGTLSINTTLYVYIIGINHRTVNGITFQGFKTAQSDGTSVALVDSHYNSTSSNGALWFNMNHWGSSSTPYNTNYGGWKGCDLRYDILGSTDKAPSGYGYAPTASRVGYDAGDTTATNPKANTLMSCLSSDLRAVMQPITIYTDNKGNASNTAANVTTSVDYLPLLAEFETFGFRTNANVNEQNSQLFYEYYSSGNSKVKYSQTNTATAVWCWFRSPRWNGATNFCVIDNNGSSNGGNSRSSLGLAPVFLV